MQILIGMVGSLLATVVAWLAYRFARDTVVPWFSAYMYPDTQVNATYYGERTDNGVTYGFTLILRRSGRKIEGLFKAHDIYPGGAISAKNYRLWGEIANNCMLLVYSGDDRIFGAGAFLLQETAAGRFLRGSMLYLSTTKNQTGAVDDLSLERRVE